jgi:hypothetical protein
MTAHPRKRRLLPLALAAALLVPAAGLFAYHRYIRENPAASCANCRRQAAAALDDYALKHDGWYPRGAGDPMRSLALAIADDPKPEHLVHTFTSHALTKQAQDYYARHKSFHEDHSCYRYNEGLRAGDPGPPILLYYHEPTTWECTKPRHRAKFIGRNVLIDGSWEFIPEDEFQRRQEATLALIASRQK